MGGAAAKNEPRCIYMVKMRKSSTLKGTQQRERIEEICSGRPDGGVTDMQRV